MRTVLGVVGLFVMSTAGCGDDAAAPSDGAGGSAASTSSASTNAVSSAASEASTSTDGAGGGGASGGGGGGDGGTGAGGSLPATVFGIVKGYRANAHAIEQPLVGATVEITDGQDTWAATSDGNGVFSIDGLPAGEAYRARVTAPTDGPEAILNGPIYGSWHERTVVVEGTSNPLAPLLPRGCSVPAVVVSGAETVFVATSEDCSLSDIVGGLRVPADGLVDAGGDAFVGVAELRIAPLHQDLAAKGDPHVKSIESMPGDLVGVNGGEPTLIHTFAAADIRVVESETGAELRLGEGAIAQLTLRGWREMSDADEIQSWSFDETAMRWVQEGTCEVDADEAQLVACEVLHFSWWNADALSPSGGGDSPPDRCVRGAVVASGEPAAFARVTATTDEDLAGGGDLTTDASGAFCIAAGTNGPWSVVARTAAAGVVLRGSASVTEQSSDATCGDNPDDCAQAGELELEADELITVRGQLGICDAEIYPDDLCGPMPAGGFEPGNSIAVVGYLADAVTSFYLGEIQITDDGSYDFGVPEDVTSLVFLTPDTVCTTGRVEIVGNGNPIDIDERGDFTCGGGGGDARLFVSGQHGISSFASDVGGDVAPETELAGANTGIGFAAHQMVVVDDSLITVSGGNVLTFDLDDSGDVAPTFWIAGANTGLTGAYGVAATSTEIFVGDESGSIRVFPVGMSGNLAPIRVIEGPLTALGGGAFVGPEQLWIDGTELIAAVSRNNVIVGFQLTDGGDPGSPEANVSPTRKLEGPLTGFTGGVGAQPRGLAVANGELFVGVPPFRVAVFDLATATGDVAPTRTIEGPFGGPTGIENTGGLWVVDGELYVASEENASVRVFDASASGQPAPLRVIEGAATGLSFPTGVVVTPR